MTATTAGLPIRTPHAAVLHELASSPVDWFPKDPDTADDIEHAEVWTDHHRVTHERHPTRDGVTRCGKRIPGSDAPSHSRIYPVGCRFCVAARAHSP
ncbi:hypothetical protein [Saccharopolyspora spinosa]|uniref:Uncharacterized protein n=1 Tax=Saccharopolyspora spinosa TaxID=60894 RepID=A0A2N3Y7Z9_SACSN|nr:hypothetical protein [Saccharopolyspora spinosa]PKW19030.1 hypothetical protein A8926_7170 [Saccharopolyspora spinosa]